MTFTLIFLFISVRTGGVVICLLPVQDDKGRAALYGHYCKVGGWRLRWSIHIRLSGFVLGEVVERRCDRARFIWFLACLVDDVRGFGTEGRRNLLRVLHEQRDKASCMYKVFSPTFLLLGLTNVTLLAQGVNIWGRLWFKQFRVFPALLWRCWIKYKHKYCLYLPRFLA